MGLTTYHLVQDFFHQQYHWVRVFFIWKKVSPLLLEWWAAPETCAWLDLSSTPISGGIQSVLFFLLLTLSFQNDSQFFWPMFLTCKIYNYIKKLHIFFGGKMFRLSAGIPSTQKKKRPTNAESGGWRCHGRVEAEQLDGWMVGGIPIPSMYGIFTYIWLFLMVNVGKYTIHGW